VSRDKAQERRVPALTDIYGLAAHGVILDTAWLKSAGIEASAKPRSRWRNPHQAPRSGHPALLKRSHQPCDSMYRLQLKGLSDVVRDSMNSAIHVKTRVVTAGLQDRRQGIGMRHAPTVIFVHHRWIGLLALRKLSLGLRPEALSCGVEQRVDGFAPSPVRAGYPRLTLTLRTRLLETPK